jgi:hypothetical protein
VCSVLADVLAFDSKHCGGSEGLYCKLLTVVHWRDFSVECE